MMHQSISEIQSNLGQTMSHSLRLRIVHLLRDVLVEEASHQSDLIQGDPNEHPG
jgi:hypothetical protein